MGGVRGDFGELKALRERLRRISSGAVRRDINRVCAEAAVKVLDDEFNTSTGPYGKPWAPLTSRTGKPLLDTGMHLRSTLTPKTTESGFVVSTSFKGAAVHQYGATIKAKPGKTLAFKVRGAPTKSRPRGRLSSTIYARSVTIPKRQYMPEGALGPRWTKAINGAADLAIRQAMGTT